jgi:hypothetical protein
LNLNNNTALTTCTSSGNWSSSIVCLGSTHKLTLKCQFILQFYVFLALYKVILFARCYLRVCF